MKTKILVVFTLGLVAACDRDLPKASPSFGDNTERSANTTREIAKDSSPPAAQEIKPESNSTNRQKSSQDKKLDKPKNLRLAAVSASEIEVSWGDLDNEATDFMVVMSRPNQELAFSPQDGQSYRLGQQDTYQIVSIGKSTKVLAKNLVDIAANLYSFSVYAISSNNQYSEPANRVYALPGEQVFTTPGTSTFIVPEGVFSISAVLVGGGGGARGTSSAGDGTAGGGGGGGGLRFIKSLFVTPGEALTVTVGAGGKGADGNNDGQPGGTSKIERDQNTLILAEGGQGGSTTGGLGGAGSDLTQNIGGGNGGQGGQGRNNGGGGGGAGAGGYSGNGGNGGSGNTDGTPGTSGSGGGGAGGSGGRDASGSGGGVGILGEGPSGDYRTPEQGGQGGSGGTNGRSSQNNGTGGAFGGGGASYDDDTDLLGGSGGSGAIRIIWGLDMSYPNNASLP